ncbi:MAG: hypothetical protein ACRDLY_17775, partial [Thermoleophilaceae bacterium]
VHDYVGLSGTEVHEAVRLLHGALPRYIAAYQDWMRRIPAGDLASAARPTSPARRGATPPTASALGAAARRLVRWADW